MSEEPTYDDETWSLFFGEWERDGDYYKMVNQFFIQPRERNQFSARNSWHPVLAETQRSDSGLGWWNWGDIPRMETIDGTLESDILEVSVDTLHFQIYTPSSHTSTECPPDARHWEAGIYEWDVGSTLGGILWSGNPTLISCEGSPIEEPSNRGDPSGDYEIPVGDPPSSGVEPLQMTVTGPDAVLVDGRHEFSGAGARDIRLRGVWTVYRPIRFPKPKPIHFVLDPAGRMEAEQIISVLPPHPRHVAKRRREQYRRPSHVLRLRGPA